MLKRTPKKNRDPKAGDTSKPTTHGAKTDRKTPLNLEALEARILLSGTWVGTDGDDSHDASNKGDEMQGLAGNDVLHGGTGADTVDGGTGSDQLFGEQGNDILISGGGSDYLDGGTGSDVFQFTGAQHGDVITVVGGNGPDALDLSGHGNSQIHDNGSSVVVELGPGHSFTVNYSQIEKIHTRDGSYAPGTIPVPGPTNIAPSAADGGVHLNEDAATAVHLAGSDPDAGDAVDHYVIDSLPDHGTLLLNGSPVQAGDAVSQADVDAGHLTFTPEANWSGDAAFGFHAHDGDALSANAGTFSLHVDPVNDAPSAENDAVATDQNVPVTTGNVLTNDSDGDGDGLVVGELSQPEHGNVTNNGDGTFTYTPEAEFHGDDSFTYAVEDGNGGSATGTVSVSVNEVTPPAPPEAPSDPPVEQVVTVPDPAPTPSSETPGGADDFVVPTPGTDPVVHVTPQTPDPTDHVPAPSTPVDTSHDATDATAGDDSANAPPAADPGPTSDSSDVVDAGPANPPQETPVAVTPGETPPGETQWNEHETIGVLDPVEHFSGQLQFNVGQTPQDGDWHAADSATAPLEHPDDPYVPTSVVELPVPRPVTVRADFLGASPGATAADVFYEVRRAGADDHHDVRADGVADGYEAHASPGRRIVETESYELPGSGAAAKAAAVAVQSPDHAGWLAPVSTGFFAKLWAAMSGIGPSRSGEQAESERGTRRK